MNVENIERKYKNSLYMLQSLQRGRKEKKVEKEVKFNVQCNLFQWYRSSGTLGSENTYRACMGCTVQGDSTLLCLQ